MFTIDRDMREAILSRLNYLSEAFPTVGQLTLQKLFTKALDSVVIGNEIEEQIQFYLNEGVGQAGERL